MMGLKEYYPGFWYLRYFRYIPIFLISLVTPISSILPISAVTPISSIIPISAIIPISPITPISLIIIGKIGNTRNIRIIGNTGEIGIAGNIRDAESILITVKTRKIGNTRKNWNLSEISKIPEKSELLYTQSQKKCNFSAWIFPGAQCQGHVSQGHEKFAHQFSKQFSKNCIEKYETVFCMPPYSLVYTLLQKKRNLRNVAILLRMSVNIGRH